MFRSLIKSKNNFSLSFLPNYALNENIVWIRNVAMWNTKSHLIVFTEVLVKENDFFLFQGDQGCGNLTQKPTASNSGSLSIACWSNLRQGNLGYRQEALKSFGGDPKNMYGSFQKCNSCNFIKSTEVSKSDHQKMTNDLISGYNLGVLKNILRLWKMNTFRTRN